MLMFASSSPPGPLELKLRAVRVEVEVAWAAVIVRPSKLRALPFRDDADAFAIVFSV